MKAHRTDGVSLTFALIFLGVAAWWLVAQFLDLSLPEVGWILAGGLILIGVLGLLGALRSGRSAAPTYGPVPHGDPVPVHPVTVEPTTTEFGTPTEFGNAGFGSTGSDTSGFARVDPSTTDPVANRSASGPDEPRPDDHRD